GEADQRAGVVGLEARQEGLPLALPHARRLDDRPAKNVPAGALAVPKPEVFYSTAEKKSQTAFALLSAVLSRWTDQIGRLSLAAAG
ncbi:MAG: hypothetical protein NUV77_22560, partial [Thermoguttaceae bacterium]|nr:hypothetical protein [Thermoguttaceae bacterium]